MVVGFVEIVFKFFKTIILELCEMEIALQVVFEIACIIRSDLILFEIVGVRVGYIIIVGINYGIRMIVASEVFG